MRNIKILQESMPMYREDNDNKEIMIFLKFSIFLEANDCACSKLLIYGRFNSV